MVHPPDLPDPPDLPGRFMLRRFSKFVAACTVLLLLAGSLVTSTGSGLSVPDWQPNTAGTCLRSDSTWVADLYEHGHRLMLGRRFLTLVLGVAMDPDPPDG